MIKINKWTDKQTDEDRQTHKQIDVHTDKDRQMDGKRDRQTDVDINQWLHTTGEIKTHGHFKVVFRNLRPKRPSWRGFFSASREYYKYCMLIKVHNYVSVFCSHNLQNKPPKNSK